MFENSPSRSTRSVGSAGGSNGSRPLNASNSANARSSANEQETTPVSSPSVNRTETTHQPSASFARSAKRGSSHRSTTAKKLLAATAVTAAAIKSAASDPSSSGNFFEHISHDLRAERFFQVAQHVEPSDLVAPRRRSVGRDHDAGEAPPPRIGGELAQQLDPGHHRHVDVGEQQLHLARFQDR